MALTETTDWAPDRSKVRDVTGNHPYPFDKQDL
jgi:hypothetical protein